MENPKTFTYVVSKNPAARREFPDILIGSPESSDEPLALRRSDHDNTPGSDSEALTRRLQAAWRPFLHRPATLETYDEMAEAAKLAFADLVPADVLATFEVNASHHSDHGVDLTMRNPPNGIPTHIASMLPAKIAQVTTWGMTLS